MASFFQHTTNPARFAGVLALAALTAAAQRASVPAGAESVPATVDAAAGVAVTPSIPPRQAREADDAYLQGARQMERKDLAAAERSFARAVQLNPGNRDYILALLVARGGRATELVRAAAQARRNGDAGRADELLAEARTLDPENRVVVQHFEGTIPAPYVPASGIKPPGNEVAATLGGAVALAPDAGLHNFDLQGDAQTILRRVYAAYGIEATFDPSVSSRPLSLSLKDVDFTTATRVVLQMSHAFAVAIQPKRALIARDTSENRSNLEPMVEETVYIPGASADQMTELANVARNVFDIKQVTASASSGDILLRGDEPTLRILNAMYADMLDGGSDVVFDVRLHEISATHMRNFGTQLPTSVGAFGIASEAQTIITQNQSLLNQAIAGGLLSANSTPLQELEFLVGSGAVSLTQFSGFLGTLGSFGGLPLAGVFLGSATSFQALLSSSDTRILDDVQLRGSDKQPANFRAGTRYPVVTATYSSGVTSQLASQLAGLNVNGTSVSSLLSQYLGSSTASIPQFQFEDLGLTLKITPQIKRGGDVQMTLEMKVESLAGGSINSIPILNSRTLTSTITVPAGQTAMMASLVSTNEIRSLSGLPYLSELPGFQGTEKSSEKDSDELLITITPHIVRAGNMRMASRPIAVPRTSAAP